MQIIKRDGQLADFDPDKIYQALIKAARTVYVIDDSWRQHLAQVTKKVVIDLEEVQVERPTINMIQSLVENRLIDAGYMTIAEHYIAYRLQRDLRETVTAIALVFIYDLSNQIAIDIFVTLRPNELFLGLFMCH